MSRDLVSKRNILPLAWGLMALATLALPLTTRAAQTDERGEIAANFTVEFEGTSICPSPDPSGRPALPSSLNYPSCALCVNGGGFYVEAQGSGYTSLGAMVIEVLKCYNPAGAAGFGSYQGFFQMTASNGTDSMKGTYVGQNFDYGPAGDALGFGPFSGTLTVTGGTGKFEGAKGSFTFTALSGPGSPGPTPNSVVGNAFYSLQGRVEFHGQS